MKRAIWVLPVVMMCGMAWGDAVDDAEAKRRGVAVEVVQLEKANARIKELEKEVASLRVKMAAATQPVASTKSPVQVASGLPALEQLLNSMPKEYWPKVGEQSVVHAVRAEWLSANVQSNFNPSVLEKATYDVTIDRVYAGNETDAAGKPLSLVHLIATFGKINVWGSSCLVSGTVTLDGVSPVDAIGWAKGKTLKISCDKTVISSDIAYDRPPKLMSLTLRGTIVK